MGQPCDRFTQSHISSTHRHMYLSTLSLRFQESCYLVEVTRSTYNLGDRLLCAEASKKHEASNQATKRRCSAVVNIDSFGLYTLSQRCPSIIHPFINAFIPTVIPARSNIRVLNPIRNTIDEMQTRISCAPKRTPNTRNFQMPDAPIPNHTVISYSEQRPTAKSRGQAILRN